MLPTIPAPGAALVSTFKYAFASVDPESVNPNNPANCLSGRIATKFPPALTQPLNADTCPALNDTFPNTTTSN